MKRLLSLLALLLSAPVFAASDVTPVYPDLILQKNVTTVSTGSPQRTQPVAYQITATGTGATVSATVKVYCKTVNLGWATGTQQGSDITLSASNTDVDTSVTVTGSCPYLYADVTAISSTTVNVVATPVYASGGSSSNPSVVTIYTPLGDSAMDDTADAVKVLNYVSENAATATAADVDAADTPDDTVITVDTGAVAATRLSCAFLNTDVAANANIDEVNIILAPAGYSATGVPITYTEADFASPSGALLVVRTSQTAGADADATPDTTLPELGVLFVVLDVGGVDSVTFTMSADAADAKVDAKCTYN